MTNFLRDKKVLIVGLGKSGAAAAEAAAALGADVWGYDAADAEKLPEKTRRLFAGMGAEPRLLTGGAVPDPDAGWALLVMSPGVSPALPFVRAAASRGAEIVGEAELAWRLSRARYVAVTGTNGKTTTTALIGEIFKAAGRRAEAVGNIGIPVISRALDADMDEAAWLIMEVSSFQLETVTHFRPVVSVLLNITPDHMDRHGNMENYAAAKANIFARQGADDFFVVNAEDALAWEQARRAAATVVPFARTREPAESPSAFTRAGRLVIRDRAGRETDLCAEDELGIPGAHNLENALAAAAAAFFAGIEPAHIAETLKTFAGVAHRLEYVDTVNGVRFVNDSKGTNPDASVKAVEAMKGGVALIAGGYDKNADFGDFVASFGGKVKSLSLMGVTAGKIRAEAEARGLRVVTLCDDMEACVENAFALAAPGDTVLLSPACASWDMYTCFEARGEDFKRCVARIAAREKGGG